MDPSSAEELLSRTFPEAQEGSRNNNNLSPDSEVLTQPKIVNKKVEDNIEVDKPSLSKITLKHKELKSTSGKCLKHPDEELKYFCFDCLTQPICSECVINGVHKTHDVQNIKKAFPIIQSKLEESLKALNLRTGQLSGTIQSFKARLKDYNEQGAIFKEEVKSIFEEIRQKIDKKERDISLLVEPQILETKQEIESAEKRVINRLHSIQNNLSIISDQSNLQNPIAVLNFYADNHKTISQLLEIEKKEEIESLQKRRNIVTPEIIFEIKSKAEDVSKEIENLNTRSLRNDNISVDKSYGKFSKESISGMPGQNYNKIHKKYE